MSFSSKYCTWNPKPKAGPDILFPYWNDLDFRLVDTANGGYVGGFGYSQHTYLQTDTLSKTIFAETKKYLTNYGNVSNFTPTEIIVCTWLKATPYPYDNYIDNPQVSFSTQLWI